MRNFVDNEFNNYTETHSYGESRESGDGFVNRGENLPLAPEISSNTHKLDTKNDNKSVTTKKNSNKLVTIAMQASGAVATAAVVVAMVVTMPFSVNVAVRDITTASAIVEINTELISEQGDFAVPVYEINEVDSAETVATGDAPTGKTVFPIGNLKSDTQYRIAIKQGEDILKEYVFRTLITEKMGRDRPFNEPQTTHSFDAVSGFLEMAATWQQADGDLGKVVTMFVVTAGKDFADTVYTATAEDGNAEFSTTLPIGEYRLHIESRYVLAKGGYSVLADETKTLVRLPADDGYYIEAYADNFGDGFGVEMSCGVFESPEDVRGKFVARATAKHNGIVVETKQFEFAPQVDAQDSLIFDTLVFGQLYDFDTQLLFVADTGTEFEMLSYTLDNVEAHGNMGIEGLVVTPVYKIVEYNGSNVVALALHSDWRNVGSEARSFHWSSTPQYQYILNMTDVATGNSVGAYQRSEACVLLKELVYMNFSPGANELNEDKMTDTIISGMLMSAKTRLEFSLGWSLPDNDLWTDFRVLGQDEPIYAPGFGSGGGVVAGQNSIGNCLPNFFEYEPVGLEVADADFVVVEAASQTEVAAFKTSAEALAYQPLGGTYELRITKVYRDNENGLEATATHTISNIIIAN